MSQLQVRPIDDEAVHDAAPAVRAHIVARLERIWASLEPHLVREEDLKPDPRFMEVGIRVLDRLMRLYRLDSPGVRPPEEGAGVSAVEAVDVMLRELEAKLR